MLFRSPISDYAGRGKKMRPDLSDPAARAAYKLKLRALARGWRPPGFALILLGVAGQFWLRGQGVDEGGLWAASWTAIAAGWVVFIAVIVYRTRYHKARMAEDPARPDRRRPDRRGPDRRRPAPDHPEAATRSATLRFGRARRA